MDGAGIERVGAVADAQEACRLFVGLGSEAADLEEFLA
jgi:hypothetical protein